MGLQRNSEKLCPLPDSRDAGDALYLPKFNSHVRCVHYSTHRERQIEISCSSSRMELPWEKVGLNSFKLFPFSLESKSTLYSLLTPFYMTLGSLKFRVFICAACRQPFCDIAKGSSKIENIPLIHTSPARTDSVIQVCPVVQYT